MGDSLLHTTFDPALLDALKEVRPRLKLCGPLRILVVVDGGIGLGGGFGVGRVVEILRDTTRGWVDFEVDTLHRSAATFNDALLNKYHQLWLFGIEGGNGALSGAEQAALLKWMNERQGGVFATGDHEDLGAALCRQVPRVGTMRRWTAAQNVPPIGGPNRIDTNRPGTAAQRPPTYALMPDSVQSDAEPQRIQWVAWMRSGGPIFRWEAPHPVLCHPTLGPIDVMPDHPHEGRCFDTAPGSFEVDVSSASEYPTKAGVRPLPTVIAYGTTLPGPPYQFAKGASPAKRFPMISVYDGQQIGIGRVVVDSTWHHWMGMNIDTIEATAGAPGASAAAVANWQKIRQYFINIAVWMATAHQRRCMARWYLSTAHFGYVGQEEFRPNASLLELGIAWRNHLWPLLGACWVRQFVFDLVQEVRPALRDWLAHEYLEVPELPPHGPGPQCLSCPPWEVFEAMVLGGVVRASMKAHAGALDQFRSRQPIKLPADDKTEARIFLEGAADGLTAFGDALQADLQRFKPTLAALKARA